MLADFIHNISVVNMTGSGAPASDTAVPGIMNDVINQVNPWTADEYTSGLSCEPLSIGIRDFQAPDPSIGGLHGQLTFDCHTMPWARPKNDGILRRAILGQGKLAGVRAFGHPI